MLGQLSVTRRLASGHCGGQRALYKPDSDTDSDTNGYCHGDSNSDSQRHSDSYGYGYSHIQRHPYSYSYRYRYVHGNSNSPPAKGYTDAKAASHSVAETVVGLLETVL